jgi:tRNA A-37 threonylcarbamoyl transferase component Bud32
VVVTRHCPRCHKGYDRTVQFCPDDGAPVTEFSGLAAGVAVALSPDYRILDWLGSGGMGEVFVAEQTRVGNRKVALKVLHRRFSEDAEFITRFQNEAASTGRINHPNVITIYESKQAPDGTLYIAMELVEGESLTARLRRETRCPLEETVEIVTQCAKALQAAHRLGIIHRDVKPDNIMLTRDADGALLVKILDFGIAKLKDSGDHTATGNVLGTPAYMSYEQASGLSSDQLDGRSDIYSLGLVTYHMLVGEPPFRADTPIAYIRQHLSEPPPPLRDRRPELAPAVEAAVLKALEKDRERRYPSAPEFAAALREALRRPAPPGPVVAPPGVDANLVPAPAGGVPPWRARRTAGDTLGGGPAGPPPASVGAPTGGTPAAGHPGAPAPRPGPVASPAWGPAPPRVPAAGAERPHRPGPGPVPGGLRSQGGDDGAAATLATAVWGLRHAVSWGMQAAVLVCVVRFAWSVVAPLVSPAPAATLEAWGRPWAAPVVAWLPTLGIGGLDVAPIIAAVVLVMGRPRLVAWLADREARWRGPARPDGVPG